MAIGDAIGTIASVAAGSYCNLQPTSPDEWVIHNLYYGGAVILEQYDGVGSVSIAFGSATEAGAHCYYAFHCTESLYTRVKNNGTASIYIGYDGVKVKD